MKTILFVLALLVTATFSASAADSDTPTTVVLKGIIYSSNGKAATSATVIVLDAKEEIIRPDLPVLARTECDTSGSYRLSLPFAQKYAVVALHDGDAAGYAQPHPPTESDNVEVSQDLSLTTAAVVAGRVTDTNGRPIENASVSLLFETEYPVSLIAKSAGLTTQTAADGSFEIPYTKPGETHLLAEADYCISNDITVAATSTSTTIVLRRKGSEIQGNVIMRESREGVSSASVLLLPFDTDGGDLKLTSLRKAPTDEFGQFAFTNLKAGKYIVVPQKVGLTSDWLGQLPGIKVELGENETTSGLILTLSKAFTVTGIVRDAFTSAPLTGVEVKSVSFSAGGMQQAKTKADGSYKLTGLSPVMNMLMLDIQKSGYTPPHGMDGASNAIILQTGKYDYVRDLALIPYVTLSGKVEDTNGTPIKGAKVSSPFGNADTGAKGEFEFQAQPHTVLTLSATREGYSPARTGIIEIKDKPVSGTVIRMLPAAILEGRVVDDKNKPVPESTVMAMRVTAGQHEQQENVAKALTDGSGKFQLKGLPEGRINILASHWKFAPAIPLNLHVKAGETTTGHVLRLRPGFQISGQVVDEKDHPIPKANVDAMKDGDFSAKAITDDQGRFALTQLTAGDYDVRAEHSSYTAAPFQKLETGTRDVVFRLASFRTVSLVGRVVDAQTRTPIDKFQVEPTAFVSIGDEKAEVQISPTEKGVFRIPNLRANASFHITVKAPNYADNMKSVSSTDTDKPEVNLLFELTSPGAVTGRVVDNSHQPMNSVFVRLEHKTSSRNFEGELNNNKMTSPDGLFRFDGIAPGIAQLWMLQAEAGKQARVTRKISVESGRVIDLGDIVFSTVEQDIAGVLYRGNKPAPGVLLQIAQNGPMERVATSAEGKFRFAKVTPTEGEEGIITIYAPDYNQSWQVFASGENAGNLTLHLGTTTLRGKVMRAGVPVRVAISLVKNSAGSVEPRNLISDQAGFFEAENLSPGAWAIDFSTGGESSSEVITVEDQPLIERTFELPAGSITGKVTLPDGTPVGGAVIAFHKKGDVPRDGDMVRSRGSATTYADGQYEIRYLSAGEYEISAMKNSVGTAMETVVLRENTRGNADLVLRSTGTGTLVSVALNMATGGPLQHARLRLTTPQGVQFDYAQDRNYQGQETIPNIPAGTYNVEVTADGFSTAKRTMEIAEGETARIEDVLYEATNLMILVQDDSEKSVRGASCTITPMDQDSFEEDRSGLTGVSGTWMTTLCAGRYTVRCSTPDGRSGEKEVVLQPQVPSAIILTVR